MLYPDSQIPPGVYEGDLIIGFWDSTNGQWEILEDCVVATNTNQIRAPFTHFSVYAVLYVPPRITQASFQIGSLRISPTEARAGEEISVGSLVTNSGGSWGEYTLVLKVNGIQIDTQIVDLEPGESDNVRFIIKTGTAGQYTIELNGQTGQYVVQEPEGEIAGSTSTTSSSAVQTPAAPPSQDPQKSAPTNRSNPLADLKVILGLIIAVVIIVCLVIVVRQNISASKTG
jgi:hypothetical protein